MNLLHMNENSGCAPFPRNKGLNFSRGEYIFFMDADDMITRTCLEEMYTLAKDYDADVVHCEKRYDADADGSNIRLVTHQRATVEQPTFHSENLAERVNFILRRDIWGTPWCKLVRRNLLTANEIRFQRVRPCDDHLWTLDIFFFAKKYLRVPNATYIWRKTETSATRGRRTIEQKMILWIESAILGLKGLDKSLGKIDFFKNNLQARYDIVNYFLRKMFSISWKYRRALQSLNVYEAIKQTFGKALEDQDIIVAALFASLDRIDKESIEQREHIKQLETENKNLKTEIDEMKFKLLEAEINNQQFTNFIRT